MNGEDMDEQNKPKSFIQIVFADVGNVFFDMQIDGVVPLQFLAVAEYLRILGEAGIARQETQRAQETQRKKIMVPGMNDEELMK